MKKKRKLRKNGVEKWPITLLWAASRREDLTGDLEVKLLICYLLDSIGHPLQLRYAKRSFPEYRALSTCFELAK